MAYLSPETNPNDNWLYALFGVFYPVILLAALLMMLVWILVDYKYVFLSIVGIALGWNHFTNFINISGPSKNAKGITVMSYNLGQGYFIRDKDKETQKNKVSVFKNYLSTVGQPDVICLQEAGTFVRSIFESQYPSYHKHLEEDKGTIIYSKYPIISGGKVEFGTRINSCLYADLSVDGQTLRVYNTHLQSNSISREADAVLEQKELNRPETWLSIKGIIEKYSMASKRRSLQAQKVKAHSSTSSHPVVIAGDLNDPPTSYTYGVLSEGMLDAFAEKGSGIGTTYGGSIPMLRIDYILADTSMVVTKYQCRKEQFSDHYPIMAKVDWQ